MALARLGTHQPRQHQHRGGRGRMGPIYVARAVRGGVRTSLKDRLELFF